MMPRIIMYISICLTILVGTIFAATYHTTERTGTHTTLTRIIPITLENEPVYPTNHAIIALDPGQEYSWQTIQLPESWPLGQYYIELWGGDNRPIPGFVAQKLTTHSLDISSIDASLNPALRIVVFQPSGVSALPVNHGIYISYAEQPNTRLFILLAVTALIYWTIFIWSGWRRGQWLQYPAQVQRLLRGQLTDGVWAAVTTIIFAGAFGIILGSFIGGIQILYVLIKIPLLMFSTMLISFTTLLILSWLLGVTAPAKQLWGMALNLLAMTALGLVSFGLILEFYVLYPLKHDQVLVAAVVFFVCAGLLAATMLYRWLGVLGLAPLKRLVLPITWLIIYGFVFMQVGWMLRPWVGVLDPVHNTVPFARPYSGNVFGELMHTVERLDGS